MNAQNDNETLVEKIRESGKKAHTFISRRVLQAIIILSFLAVGLFLVYLCYELSYPTISWDKYSITQGGSISVRCEDWGLVTGFHDIWVIDYYKPDQERCSHLVLHDAEVELFLYHEELSFKKEEDKISIIKTGDLETTDLLNFGIVDGIIKEVRFDTGECIEMKEIAAYYSLSGWRIDKKSLEAARLIKRTEKVPSQITLVIENSDGKMFFVPIVLAQEVSERVFN